MHGGHANCEVGIRNVITLTLYGVLILWLLVWQKKIKKINEGVELKYKEVSCKMVTGDLEVLRFMDNIMIRANFMNFSVVEILFYL